MMKRKGRRVFAFFFAGCCGLLLMGNATAQESSVDDALSANIPWGDPGEGAQIWRCLKYAYPDGMPECDRECYEALDWRERWDLVSKNHQKCHKQFVSDIRPIEDKRLTNFWRNINKSDPSGELMMWDFGLMAQAVASAAREHFQKFPSCVADTYKCSLSLAGTLANASQTFGHYSGIGCEDKDYKRGCVAVQDVTLKAGQATGDTFPWWEDYKKEHGSHPLTIARLMVGNVMEHHSVVFYPTGTDWKKTGMVMDPWIRQCEDPSVFIMTYKAWAKSFRAETLLGSVRLEE